KRPQLALETYQEVINRDGQGELTESAHLRRAEIFAAQGNWSAAVAEYQRVLSVAKSDAAKIDALYGMAKAQQELKHYEAAAETYRRVVREFPSRRFAPASVRGLAMALSQAGRKAEAKQVWQEALDAAPKDASAAEAHVELGVLFQSEGQ